MDILPIIPEKPKNPKAPKDIKQEEIRRANRIAKIRVIKRVGLLISPIITPFALHFIFHLHLLFIWMSIGVLLIYTSYHLHENTSCSDEFSVFVGFIGIVLIIILNIITLAHSFKTVNVPIHYSRFHYAILGSKLIVVLDPEEGGSINDIPVPAYKWKLAGMYRRDTYNIYGGCNGSDVFAYFVEDK